MIKQATSAPQKRGFSYSIGARNAGTVAANTGKTLLLSIRNNLASVFHYDRIAIRYATGLQTCLLWLFDTQFNREVITGETQLCILGQPNNAAYNAPFYQLLHYQPLSPGQAVDIYIQTFATGLAANDIGVSIIGQYFMD